MPASSWDRTWSIFHEASKRPLQERAAYVEGACDDPEVRAEVRSLLAAAEAGGDLLDSNAELTRLLGAGAGSEAEIGESIGPYRLLRRVGEGGMGVVYEAEQGTLARRVALKLIKLGMDTREVVARFEAERQVLALMEHPGIARVFDAGVSAAGKPFFAMEYVEGVPIDELCDRRRLSVEERLGLFLRVCEAVRHAHRRGIIHRDLKPSNILVTAEGEPKIIDFGIAKAIDGPGTRRTLATALGRLLGTPEYMSPEQAAQAPDVDTRADVYALGVVLYELLTGVLPFEVEGVSFSEIQRRIQEEEAPAPSLRLRRLEEPAADEAAAARRVDARSLRRRLSGELDWIVIKALARERDARYDSVADLAADIRRHLAHRPVLAGPPSRLYRARKLLRRHTASVLAAGLALLVVVAAAVLLGWQSHRLARALASEAGERAKAEQVTRFLEDLFESQDPFVAQGEEITGRELLDRGIERLSGSLTDQPLVEAALLATTGRVAYQLGEYERARWLHERALDLRRRHLGAEHRDVAGSLRDLGLTLHASGDFEGAAERLGDAVAILERTPDGDLQAWSDTQLRLGVARQALGDRGAAAARYAEALAGARRVGDEALVAEVLGRQASLALERRELAAAEETARGALDMQRRIFGSDDPRLTTARSVLAHVLHRRGDSRGAEAVYRENLAVQEQILGPGHPAVGGTLNGLGAALYDGGRDAAAEPVLRRAVAIFEGLGAEGRAGRSSAIANLALVLHRRGAYAEAGRLHAEALAIDRELYGTESAKVAADLNNLGWLHHDAGDLERAESYYLQALEMHRAVFGPAHPSAAFQLNNLAQLDHQRGRFAAAEARARAALELRLAALAPDHPLVAASEATLGAALTSLGRLAEAEPLLRRALATQRAELGGDDWHAADVESALGECLALQGRRAEAAPLLRAGYETLLAARGEDDRRTRLARTRLERHG